MTKITYIPGEIANAAIDEHGNRKPITRTQHIFDDNLNKPQSQVNEETTEAISHEVTRAQNAESGLDTRLQTVEQLAEISIGGGDIGIGTAADFESDAPEDLAKVPTVGAILSGANDGVYDISARHNGTKYADLAAALGTNGINIPVGVRKGGMSVKFVQSSDNKYVEYLYKLTSTAVADFTNIDNWEKMNLEDDLQNIDKKVFDKDVNVSSFIPNYYKNLNRTKLTTSVNEYEGAAYMIIPVIEGEKYKIYSKGTSNTVGLYAVTDIGRNVLVKEGSANTRENGLEITIGEGGAFLYVNSGDYDATTDKVIKLGSYQISGLGSAYLNEDYTQDVIKNGDNIICFGDSITEFKYEGSGYVEYLAKLLQRDVYRAGIGGTRYVPRADVNNPEDIVSSTTAYAALDILNLVDAWCDNDYSLTDAAATYLSDDGVNASVTNLKAHPIENVDIVTILAGTNDFSGAAPIGTPEDIGVDTVCGALKYILTKLLTTNPKLKVYIFTPLVRYFGSRTTENWCDNVIRANGDSYINLVNAIMNTCAKNHIPVCDLYHTLGWNRDNFDEYFGTEDTTHPRLGFRDIARMMYNFIMNNNFPYIDITDLKKSLSEKVDKVEGKGLSTNDFTNSEKEVVDSGSIVSSDDYIQAITDNEYKILEGIKSDGTKEVNVDVELKGNRISTITQPEYIEAKTDHNGKLIEGITYNGKKHISDFDDATKKLIKDFVHEGELNNNLIEINQLDANFVSPVPVAITGTKGDADAEYNFELPLSEDAFNIRFKFRITEDIYNLNETVTIANIGNISIVATPTKLTQRVTDYTLDSETRHSYWPSFVGGISINNSYIGPHGGVNSNRNIGDFAFSIMYTGNEDVVSVENTGSAFILTVGETVHTFSYSTYETVDSLYEALSAINDIVLDYRGLETRQCSELAVFDSAYLVSNYYGITTGQDSGTEEEYRDAAPLFIPYSVSERWHLAEIVKIGNKVFSSVDGIIKQYSDFNNSKNLVLGGNCGVVFKEFAVSLDSSLDAEFVTIPNGNNPITRVISSWNPHIVVLEGHGITKTPTYQVAVTERNLDTSIDRLQLLFETYSTRGYVPVSLLEIADFYDGNRNLPKRCFTIIFDDFRWDNFLDLDNRTVFTKFGIRAALAIITDKKDPIVYNGTTLTKKEAADIGRRVGFDSVSHTRTHRKMDLRKPSDYIPDLLADIYSADINGITSDILVYPSGRSNLYLQDVMAWVGMRLGIQVLNAYTDRAMNTFNTNRYTINREEIGFRQPISSILSKIV